MLKDELELSKYIAPASCWAELFWKMEFEIETFPLRDATAPPIFAVFPTKTPFVIMALQPSQYTAPPYE